MSINRLRDYLEKINILSLHPKHEINILTKFTYSKLRWDLTIYHFPETWIVQNLDNKVNRYIRKWLSIPISRNVNHLRLKVKQLGIDLQLHSNIYRLYKLNQITVRNILKSSNNQSMREFFEITAMKITRNGSIVKRSGNVKIAKSERHDGIKNNLKQENTLISSLQQKISKTLIRNWNLLTNTVAPNVFNFCGWALIFSLNSDSDVASWMICDSPNCELCGKLQTQIHFLNNFTSVINCFSTILLQTSVTTRFSRPSCSILPTQTSVMCFWRWGR